MGRLWYVIIIAIALLTLARGTLSAQESGLTDGLAAYWPLDELSGIRYDAHANQDLTDNNTVGYATGIISNSANLVASNNEYLSHGDSEALSSGDVDMTLAAWIKSANPSGLMPVLSKSEYALYIEGDSALFHVQGATLSQTLALTGVIDGAWHYVVAYHDSTNDELGVIVDVSNTLTLSYSGGITDTTAPFVIGYDGASYLSGDVDEVGIWKRVLSSSEIAQLYNEGAGLAYTEFNVTTTYDVNLPFICKNMDDVGTVIDEPIVGINIGVAALDFEGDTTWWDWAKIVSAMFDPLVRFIGAASDIADELHGTVCDTDVDLYLAMENPDYLVEQELGAEPTLAEMVYSFGLAMSRPIGWIRAAIKLSSDLDAAYLTALLYFLLSGTSWIAFVAVVTYSLSAIRWFIKILTTIRQWIPFI